MNKELENNTTLSHYRIVSKIGKGGMGEVYLAEDTKLDRRVALKILPAEFAEDKDRMSRFVREAKSASALNHPNIITIYEIGESEGTHFIATEFIDGKTLGEYAKSIPLNFKSVLEIAIQVASALDEAHQAGIVHRDIKPDNVMIRENGLAKILDFGIAKLSAPLESGAEAATAIKSGTSPGMIIGTANYMSPEQAKGQTVDARTDIFSFGVVLYEMLAGHLPFAGESAMEMIGAILKDEPKLLPSDVPSEITKIINQCLRKDAGERYQTIRNVLNDLKDVKQDLEFQDKLERSVIPHQDENNTQILPAATLDETNRTTTNQTVASHPTKRYLAIGLAVLLVSAIGFFGYRSFAPNKQIESIAVMPFVNESGNADVEYLSDGMTETLINSLSQLPNLSVKARSSVFRYKGKELDPKKIASELNVQAILTGRVVQRGEQVTLNLELIDAQTENVLWGNRYERKSSDLVSLQSEIARDVSSKLKSKLSGAEIAKVEKTYTTNPEAYQLYLKGRYHAARYTEEGFRKAIDYFNQAIAIDPTYALAYDGLAYCYYSSWYIPAKEGSLKAKAAAMKALEIDPSLAEAHASLANIYFWYDYDWAAAEREFKRSIELNPNYGYAHTSYGILLATLGRFDEAVAEAKRGVELEPLSAELNTSLGFVYYYAKRYDLAAEQLNKTIEFEPNFWWAHTYLARIYEKTGNIPAAISELEKAQKMDGATTEVSAALGHAYASAGNREEAQKIINELKEPSNRIQMDGYEVAIIYAALGERDQAFAYLENIRRAAGF